MAYMDTPFGLYSKKKFINNIQKIEVRRTAGTNTEMQ